MKMQDNELDTLFRSNLEDFETEPSARVWQNIDAELKTGKRRVIVLMPFLSVAASIIVLVTAGILFIPHKTRVAQHHPVNNLIARNIPQVKTITVVPATTTPHITPKTLTAKAAKYVARLQPAKKYRYMLQPPVANSTINQSQVINQPVQQVIAMAPQILDKNVQPAKIDTLLIAENSAPAQNIKPATITDIAAPEDKLVAKTNAKKHRIHSFGDMMNVVIAAVDKRKDKIIEFSDTDDDEATITGVNLGIVAVKKQN
jgi:hypothetical protein